MKLRTILSVTGLSALMTAGLVATVDAQGAVRTNAILATAQGKRERHPEIRRAMKALTRARTDLQHADRDFAGHRAKAVALVDQALAECRAALAADRR